MSFSQLDSEISKIELGVIEIQNKWCEKFFPKSHQTCAVCESLISDQIKSNQICFFCNKHVCLSCFLKCSKCDQYFCSFCSIPTYSSSGDTAICLSCYK